MSTDRFTKAVERIEAAAARIAAGLATAPDADLADRHARLRAETGAVLARLDRLIGAGAD